MFRFATVASRGLSRNAPCRGFAKAAGKVPTMGDHKLKINGVSGRMAHRILNATYNTGANLKDTNAFFQETNAHLKASPAMFEALTAKHIKADEKEKLLADIIFKGMKNKNQVGQAVIMSMIADGTFEKNFGEVTTDFGRLVYAELGVVPAEVVSAVDLTKGQLDKIKSKLNGLVAKGESVELTTKTDPTILGGLVLRLGDRAQDLSVSSRLAQLESGIRAVA